MKKRVIKAGLLAVAMLASTATMAAPFNYNYIEGGVGELDEGDALFVNGAMDINKNWGIVGGLELGSFDPDYDITLLEAGAQYHQQVNSRLAWHAGLKLLYVNIDGPNYNQGLGNGSNDADDIGLVANGGVRFLVTPKFQLEADVKHFKNDALLDDGLGLQGAARYYFDPRLSVAGGLAIDTELDGLFASLRYDL